jgi:hypothetical protein
MNTLPTLPDELWDKILNYKRRKEYDDRWGWRKEIDLSNCVQLRDHQRWWVGNHRHRVSHMDWPDLDRAWFIYYLKYMKEDDAPRVLQMVPGMEGRWARDTVCSGTGNVIVSFYKSNRLHRKLLDHSWLYQNDPFYTHFNNRFALLNEIIQTTKKPENDSL